MDDIALAFDPTGFLSGIKAVENQLVSLNDNFKKTGDTGEKKNQKVQLSAMNLMGVFAKMGAVVGVFKMALSGIPEIGQTFKIAGDIFQRNLLWPLRKELVPLLQSVLDWVRDNRAMFVKWGTVIANVFRAVFSIIKQVITMAKELFNTLSNSLERIFGKTTKTVTEMANLILFKITAVAMFILMTIQPILEWIIKQFVKIIGYVAQFVKGFINGFGNITPILKNFSAVWDTLVSLFDKILPKQSAMNGFFKSLGSIIGTTVLAAVLGLIQALDFLIHSLGKAVNGYQKLKAIIKGNSFEVRRLEREQEKENKQFEKRSADRTKILEDSIKRTWSLINSRPKGQVTNTNNNSTTVNDNKVVNIRVDGSKDPKVTANEVKNTLAGELRESKYRTGGR